MEDRVGEEFDALIISTTKFGFFVELEKFFVEGLVPIDTLPGDRYSLSRKYPQDRRRSRLAGSFRSATACASCSIAWTRSSANCNFRCSIPLLPGDGSATGVRSESLGAGANQL